MIASVMHDLMVIATIHLWERERVYIDISYYHNITCEAWYSMALLSCVTCALQKAYSPDNRLMDHDAKCNASHISSDLFLPCIYPKEASWCKVNASHSKPFLLLLLLSSLLDFLTCFPWDFRKFISHLWKKPIKSITLFMPIKLFVYNFLKWG